MKIAVIIAMEEEIGLLKKSMNDITTDTYAGITVYKGTYGKHQLFVAQSGIGKVQAGMTTTILSLNYNPDVVINTGSAGGIGEGLSVGDVVVSTKVAYHDVDVTGSGYKMGQLPQKPLYFEANADLVDEVVDAASICNQTCHKGLIVSGDQFIESKEHTKQILSYFPDALASEMEGAAVGQVANQFKIPFVVIRAMSDVGDENANVSFDEFVRESGERSVQMLLSFMDRN